MKRALQWIVLGPLALFWFVLLWVMSPVMFFLLWITEKEDEADRLRTYWDFSLVLFYELRDLAVRE